MKEQLKLHIGCGPVHLDGWVNIDICNPTADLILDACLLDSHFKEGCADACFASHVFEHLETDVCAPMFLKQCFRVLKPGGVLRLVVPDLKTLATKYLRGENLRDVLIDETKRYTGLHDTAAARFHYWCAESSFQHKMTYDFETLKIMLSEAGFVNIKQCPFGVSEHIELRGLDRFKAESVSVEGTKP